MEQESIKENIKENIADSIKDSIKENIKDSIKENITDSIKEASKTSRTFGDLRTDSVFTSAHQRGQLPQLHAAPAGEAPRVSWFLPLLPVYHIQTISVRRSAGSFG